MSSRADADERFAGSWRKARRSANNAHCVEVAVVPGAVGVRDSKDRAGGVLVVSPQRWAEFLSTLR